VEGGTNGESRLASGESSALNWLRVAFAFLVLVGHARQHLFVEYSVLSERAVNPFVEGFYFLTASGAPSVIGFFVLSGYLITLLYFRHLKEGTLSAGAFLINRGVRLYTVLVPALVSTGLLVHFSPLTSDISLRNLFAHLLFLQPRPLPYFAGNEPLWSLGYEGWCYVTFCGLVSGIFRIKRGQRLKGLLWVLIGVAPLCLFSIWMTHYFLLWCLGALAAIYAVRAESVSRRPRPLFTGAACVVVLLGFLAARLGLQPPYRDYAVAVPLAVSLGLASGLKERCFPPFKRLGKSLS
jgi:peptidoglycan/LPS O-acetylase OafA/YrhL